MNVALAILEYLALLLESNSLMVLPKTLRGEVHRFLMRIDRTGSLSLLKIEI